MSREGERPAPRVHTQPSSRSDGLPAVAPPRSSPAGGDDLGPTARARLAGTGPAQARPGAAGPARRISASAARTGLGSSVGYYDREGRFVYATPAMAAYFGMTPDQLIGRTWYEIGVPPENVVALEAARRRVLETGAAAREEAVIKINGRSHQTEFVIKPTFGLDGLVAGTVVTARDGSERTTHSRGATRLDRTLQILSAVDQVIVRTRDPNVILEETCRIAAGIGGFELAWIGMLEPESGNVRLAHNAGRDEGLLARITVTAREEPSGHGVVGTAIRENRTAIVQDVKNNSRMSYWRSFFDQLGYRTAAGFPIRISGVPVGALVLYSARTSRFDAVEARLFEQVAGDISNALTSIATERAIAEAQAALARSERRYRDLFDVNPHPLAVVDVETLRFLAVNDAAVTDYGYTRDDFLEMTVLDIVAPDEARAVQAAIQSILPGGGFRTSGPWRQKRKDGSMITVEVSAHDLDFDGRPARLMLAIDVTTREKLQARFEESTRLEAMGSLAGGMAHDFNNLLTAINGYSDILIGELGDDPRVDSAREIRRAGARAADLTRQVLAFARRQEWAPRPIDVNGVVGSVTTLLRRLIGENISLRTRSSSDPAVIRADTGQIEQVLVNLAVNARDAMPLGGVLEIAVELVADAAALDRGMEGEAVLLSVSDNGSGMDDATLERAFEPFFTTKEAGQGTGLGLATVYGIVRQAGGQIWAESSIGHGTCISALFPRLDVDADLATAEAPAVSGPGLRATVLAVEDDPLVRAFVVSTLERAGYRVLVAASPAEAIALSEGLTERIDLLVSDVVMPGSSGHDLAWRLLAVRPETRVVLMSGYDVEPSRSGEDPRLSFLPKPFDGRRLLTAVEQALESATHSGDA